MSENNFKVTAYLGDWTLQVVTFINGTQFFISLDNDKKKIHWVQAGRDTSKIKVFFCKLAGVAGLALSKIYHLIKGQIEDIWSYEQALMLNIPHDMFKRLYRPKAKDKFELIDIYLREYRK